MNSFYPPPPPLPYRFFKNFISRFEPNLPPPLLEVSYAYLIINPARGVGAGVRRVFGLLGAQGPQEKEVYYTITLI